jgi:hypothetical protein
MVTATVTDHWQDTKRIHVVGTIVFSGNYTAGGDAAITLVNQAVIKSASAPEWMQILGLSKYQYIPVLTSFGKVKVIVPNTGLEYAQGAYGSDITGDTVSFYAIFPKFI